MDPWTMKARHHLWPDNRVAYRSAIYLRATARSMIQDHNAGICRLSPKHLDQVGNIIVTETQNARGILHEARERALGYVR